MIIKCGRREFTINTTDDIMHNGASYQIVTQVYSKGFSEHYPVIAKVKAEKMIKDGILILDRIEKSRYVKMDLEYYKINSEVYNENG